MTDARLRHTEMKTDLNKLSEKIDSLSSQIKQLELPVDPKKDAIQSYAHNQGPELEAVVIMQNVSRIIKVLICCLHCPS